MPGLARRDDRTYVAAFQGIDQAVYNAWFMSTFVGGPLLVAAALVLHLDDDATTLGLLVAALVLAVATVAITVSVHLPLNKEIQEVDVAGGADPGAARTRFEGRWVRFNVLRTVTSVGCVRRHRSRTRGCRLTSGATLRGAQGRAVLPSRRGA